MSLVLNEEEHMLREAARDFLTAKASPAALRALRDQADPIGFSKDLWKEMGAMGWLGVLIAEDHGGVDLGHHAAGVILEEMGRNLTASPFLSTSVLAASALNLAGTEAQKAAHLPAIAAGERVIAFAFDERARHDGDHIETRAVRDGNGFRLSGAKRFAPHAMGADAFVVAAKTEEGAIGLFLVEARAEGLSVEPKRTIDSHVAGALSFDEVRLEGDAAMTGGAGDPVALVLDAGRACLAAESLGVAEGAFALTLDYLKTREQFGQPIGAFQGLQHRAAHLLSEMELARSLVIKALRALDETPAQAGLWCAAAKAKTCAVSRLSASEGIQMFGGVGMTDEYDIGLYYKRAQAAGEYLGDDAYHAGWVARSLGF